MNNKQYFLTNSYDESEKIPKLYVTAIYMSGEKVDKVWKAFLKYKEKLDPLNKFKPVEEDKGINKELRIHDKGGKILFLTLTFIKK